MSFKEINKNKNWTTYFLDFEEAVKRAPVIKFNENSVEFPHMVIFSSEDKGLVYSLLNPGIDILKTKEDEIRDMIRGIEAEEDGVVFLDTNTKPAARVRLNLNQIKNQIVFIKEYENTFIANNLLFTTSKMEFEGAGLFTSKNEVYLVDEELFVEIKKILKGER